MKSAMVVKMPQIHQSEIEGLQLSLSPMATQCVGQKILLHSSTGYCGNAYEYSTSYQHTWNTWATM